MNYLSLLKNTLRFSDAQNVVLFRLNSTAFGLFGGCDFESHGFVGGLALNSSSLLKPSLSESFFPKALV